MFAFGAVFASFHPQDRKDREDSTSFSVKRPSSSGGGAAARGRVQHDQCAESHNFGKRGAAAELAAQADAAPFVGRFWCEPHEREVGTERAAPA